jgi:transposase InsO family protein
MVEVIANDHHYGLHCPPLNGEDNHRLLSESGLSEADGGEDDRSDSHWTAIIEPWRAAEFVHVAVNDHSRVTYAEILADERASSAAAFLSRAVAWFAKRGIIIERVMTSHEFALLCRALQVRHIRTKPYTPRTNGKVERVIQTLLREWAYRFTYNSSDERQRWLRPFLHFYNFHRAHSALAYNPPISRLDKNNVLRRNS